MVATPAMVSNAKNTAPAIHAPREPNDCDARQITTTSPDTTVRTQAWGRRAANAHQGRRGGFSFTSSR